MNLPFNELCEEKGTSSKECFLIIFKQKNSLRVLSFPSSSPP
jgi:hypothetical protein